MAGPSVAAPVPAKSLSRSALVGAGSLVLLLIVVVGGLAGGLAVTGSASAPSSAASSVAIADIPSGYLALYQRAAGLYGVDWTILAAIGKIECDHGRSRAPGCTPPGTLNGAGATGPMQFLGSTWRRGT